MSYTFISIHVVYFTHTMRSFVVLDFYKAFFDILLLKSLQPESTEEPLALH